MLRSRRKDSYPRGTSEGRSEDDGKDISLKSRFLSSHSYPSQSIVPVWVMVLVVTIVFVLGYASQHYQRSRGEEHYQFHGLSGTTSKGKAEGLSTTSAKSLLNPEEDDQLEFDESGQRYHVIFSTDCSPYQQWQR
jgi:hypothetical protein